MAPDRGSKWCFRFIVFCTFTFDRGLFTAAVGFSHGLMDLSYRPTTTFLTLVSIVRDYLVDGLLTKIVDKPIVIFVFQIENFRLLHVGPFFFQSAQTSLLWCHEVLLSLSSTVSTSKAFNLSWGQHMQGRRSKSCWAPVRRAHFDQPLRARPLHHRGPWSSSSGNASEPKVFHCCWMISLTPWSIAVKTPCFPNLSPRKASWGIGKRSTPSSSIPSLDCLSQTRRRQCLKPARPWKQRDLQL